MASNKDARTPTQGHQQREGERLGSCLVTAELIAQPATFWGPGTAPADCQGWGWSVMWNQAEQEESWRIPLSWKVFWRTKRQRPSSSFSPPSLLLTGTPGTSCALSWHLNEETQSRRHARLLKSVVNDTSAEMKAGPQNDKSDTTETSRVFFSERRSFALHRAVFTACPPLPLTPSLPFSCTSLYASCRKNCTGRFTNSEIQSASCWASATSELLRIFFF